MPDWSSEVRRPLSSLQLSPTREREIVDELSQHLDDRYRESIDTGASPDEARRVALADFRSGDLLAQHLAPLRQAQVPAQITLAAPSGHPLADLWQDLRYGTRILWKQPAFAATAVLTLAFGIGATTAIFSVVYGVLLKPLPFREPERLVSVRQHAPRGVGTNQGRATYFTYRENQSAFEAIGAWCSAAFIGWRSVCSPLRFARVLRAQAQTGECRQAGTRVPRRSHRASRSGSRAPCRS
jgi:putative ABC transport system permease protein